MRRSVSGRLGRSLDHRARLRIFRLFFAISFFLLFASRLSALLLNMLPAVPTRSDFSPVVGMSSVRVDELVAAASPCSASCQERRVADTKNLEIMLARVAYLEDEVKFARQQRNKAVNDANMMRIAYESMREKASTFESQLLQHQRLAYVQRALAQQAQAQAKVPPAPMLSFLPSARPVGEKTSEQQTA